MKLKKVSFAMITGVAALSVFALTSCGDKESVDIASYSNEITAEAFNEKVTEKFAAVDLTQGYEMTQYSYSNMESKSNNQKTVMESLSKGVEKFDATNKVYYSKATGYSNQESNEGTRSSETNIEYQIQSDDKFNYRIDMVTKTYYNNYGDAENYADDSYQLQYAYQGAIYAMQMNTSICKTKYFNDNDTFTVEISVDKETQDKYNNEQTGEVKTKYEMEGKFVIQFYAKDDVYYLAFDGSMSGSYTTSKGDKSTSSEGKMEASGYSKLVKKAQTIDKLDLSKYDLMFDLDK